MVGKNIPSSHLFFFLVPNFHILQKNKHQSHASINHQLLRRIKLSHTKPYSLFSFSITILLDEAQIMMTMNPFNQVPTMSQQQQQQQQQQHPFFFRKQLDFISNSSTNHPWQKQQQQQQPSMLCYSKDETEIRKSFLLFIKILFKYISNDELLSEQCKLLIYKCRLDQQQSTSSSLQHTVSAELKKAVGNSIWNQATVYYTYHRVQRIEQGKLQQQQRLKFPIDVSELFLLSNNNDARNHGSTMRTTATTSMEMMTMMSGMNCTTNNHNLNSNNNIMITNLDLSDSTRSIQQRPPATASTLIMASTDYHNPDGIIDIIPL
jgi:hypothetical protein